MRTALEALPEPPINLSDREREFYPQVIAQVAPSARAGAANRALAAGCAQAMAELETCGAMLEREGLVIETPKGKKAHPAVVMRDTAAKRLAALASRLKITPTGDKRELLREVGFESNYRSAAVVAGTKGDAGEIDWVQRLKAEVGNG
jgi:phage terminase small subunit